LVEHLVFVLAEWGRALEQVQQGFRKWLKPW
jgi:hypothetical protein